MCWRADNYWQNHNDFCSIGLVLTLGRMNKLFSVVAAIAVNVTLYLWGLFTLPVA
jgi:hypothetical protein